MWTVTPYVARRDPGRRQSRPPPHRRPPRGRAADTAEILERAYDLDARIVALDTSTARRSCAARGVSRWRCWSCGRRCCRSTSGGNAKGSRRRGRLRVERLGDFSAASFPVARFSRPTLPRVRLLLPPRRGGGGRMDRFGRSAIRGELPHWRHRPLPPGVGERAQGPESSKVGSAAMLVGGVPIDDRHVPQLAALFPTELAKKLIVARTLGSRSSR